jgi:hypothetical protein
MNYNIGIVTLHSQDKNRMLDFLSDVLEFDIDSATELVSHGAFIFQLNSTSIEPSKLQVNPGVEFSFSVKSEEELQEIMRKYHFFLFRKPPTDSLKEKISLLSLDHKKTLVIEDIDRRLWRFDLPLRINEI